ncbi:MAG: glutamate-5-semialdehyde dehydrogenase [Coriobacteriia bacterium]|nr:glutamate-5-semialdehyde dehydrogenase [Coriobacteriia bacterium]
MGQARQAALLAKDASRPMGLLSEEQRNRILEVMADALRMHSSAICAANAQDMEAARAKGTKESLLDRLYLDEARVEAMAQGLESLAALPDPTGRVLERRTLPNGIELSRVTVPLGVVAMVYEARPNVTADAAGICLKSGNACVLRGGSLAIHSCVTIAHVMHDAAVDAGAPRNCITIIESTDREETGELLSLRGLVDVLIPRGGAGLIERCVREAQVPVIETGTGNCHVYVEKTADFDMARAIVMNAKTQRTGVCNACESLLVDAGIKDQFLPLMLADLAGAGVVIHGDQEARAAVTSSCALDEEARSLVASHFVDATEEDWGTEYLDLEISVRSIRGGVQEAIDHINRYGTHHSEVVVTQDASVAEAFCRGVDAAAVYVNASSRFTDGGEFGLGAEIGISTQKLHVRGPFALEALTTYKYVMRGEGQVRP